MSIKNTSTTSDYIPWEQAMNLIHRTYRDKDYRMSLFLGCGCFFGLRFSDLQQLTWEMVMADSFSLIEKKTQKRRTIKVNPNFKKHIEDCYSSLGEPPMSQKCFVSRLGSPYTIQAVNKKLKRVKTKYGIKIDHISTHTMRKTFGRKVFESAGENAEMALVKLMELFNHSSVAITKKYLGLRNEELMEAYDLLDF